MTSRFSFDDLPLIPAPASGRLLPGELALTSDTTVETAEALSELREVLLDRLSMLNHSVAEGTFIHLSLSAHPGMSGSDEGYALRILASGVRLSAGTQAGIFRGLQTLGQLIDGFTIPGEYAGAPSACVLPCLEIDDAPRFRWRGMMLDVSRHFLTVPEVKALLDQFAALKFNVFHWHLTDDQGWRVEIKSRPELTAVGATRATSPRPDDRKKPDGVPYGPYYYTQEEIREVVEHARQRSVTIVPEIDLPGHMVAALASYPSLGCSGGPYAVSTTWGVEEDVLCLGKPTTLAFVFDVLGEIASLFPGPFLHVGGDEVPTTKWLMCPCCQAATRKAGVAPGEGLRKVFFREVENFLAKRGKRAVCWDEVLDDDPAAATIISSWRGVEAGVEAAARGNDVVMCPHTHCYLDYRCSDAPGQRLGAPNGLFLSLKDCYDYDPVDPNLNPQQASHILGLQGNIWTEYMWSADDVNAMVFPRAHAIAEVGWSPRSRRHFLSFQRRLAALTQGLIACHEEKQSF